MSLFIPLFDSLKISKQPILMGFGKYVQNVDVFMISNVRGIRGNKMMLH
jgi:hypothetical protein